MAKEAGGRAEPWRAREEEEKEYVTEWEEGVKDLERD